MTLVTVNASANYACGWQIKIRHSLLVSMLTRPFLYARLRHVTAMADRLSGADSLKFIFPNIGVDICLQCTCFLIYTPILHRMWHICAKHSSYIKTAKFKIKFRIFIVSFNTMTLVFMFVRFNCRNWN